MNVFLAAFSTKSLKNASINFTVSVCPYEATRVMLIYFKFDIEEFYLNLWHIPILAKIGHFNGFLRTLSDWVGNPRPDKATTWVIPDLYPTLSYPVSVYNLPGYSLRLSLVYTFMTLCGNHLRSNCPSRCKVSSML